MDESSSGGATGVPRRSVLAALGAATTALAGCSTGDPDAADPETTATTATTATTDGDGDGGARTVTTAEPATTAAPGERAVALERVGGRYAAPVGVEVAAGHRYVVDQAGLVRRLDGGTFLDVRGRMVGLGGYEERGLLGLAFHPGFPDDDRVYVRYSAPPREGTPDGYDHTFVLSEFRATPAAADPDSERVLLEIPQPQSNHNAGAVAFGPDGLLYVATGDGGAGGDRGRGHVEDWYGDVPGGNGQDATENLLGSILRIDPDGRTDGAPYGIPADNPLVGREGLDEQYAWGFRNPWRMSFDPETGDLYAADVGQSAFEEIDRVVAGGNYGWNVREGTHCFGVEECPAETPDGDRLRDPVIEYPHSGATVSGIAVIGGYRYRGSGLPSLSDAYVFADWRADGRLFVATPREGAGLWPTTELAVAGDPGTHVLAFGYDRSADRLLVCSTDSSTPTGSSGRVHELHPA